MLEYLSKEVAEGLALAQKRAARRKSRLRVHVDGEIYPVLRLWEDGLALDAAQVPHLRGLIDVYDGSRHIFQCLIVAAEAENGELICDFKRSTAVADHAARDFWLDENAPVGFLPRN
jgi:hypothetical protein